MQKFLDLLKSKGFEIFPSEKVNLDYLEREEYQDEGEIFNENVILETEKSGEFRNIKHIPFDGSFFKYFLDGSRKVYKICDIIHGKKYLPIVCGQIGVGCTTRHNKQIQKLYLIKRNLLLVPDNMNRLDLKRIKKILEGNSSYNVRLDGVIEYNYSTKPDKKPLDLARAKIIKEMHNHEIGLVSDLTASNKLKSHEMLIIDGSLEFSDARVNEENFRNVVGVSKSFNVHHTSILKEKSREIGSLLVKLKFGERTPVYCRELGKIIIGAWYLRIRDEKRMKNQLDGIIKIEKVANKKEEEHIKGFDSFEIDNISKCLLMERNVSAFGADVRWANHLYPIFLTEKMIKSGFISDAYFLNVF